MDFFNGMPIIVTDGITKKVRCRKHKKKRIDKKWLKKYGYKDIPDNTKVIVFENKLLVTQKCYDRLKESQVLN